MIGHWLFVIGWCSVGLIGITNPLPFASGLHHANGVAGIRKSQLSGCHCYHCCAIAICIEKLFIYSSISKKAPNTNAQMQSGDDEI